MEPCDVSQQVTWPLHPDRATQGRRGSPIRSLVYQSCLVLFGLCVMPIRERRSGMHVPEAADGDGLHGAC